MFTETTKVFAIAGLIVATGIATVELTRSPAQAEGVDYVTARVDGAFQAVSEMPQVAAVRVPLAVKGDLQMPHGCTGIGTTDAQAECMDTAYEIDSEPSIVVETRIGSTSTLMRMDAMTLAGVSDEPVQQSE